MSEQESLDKAARLLKLTHLLYRNRAGLTAQQLARECGVSVRTAYRDLDTLEQTGVPLTELEGDRFAIIAGHFLPPVHFNLEEAVALVLAARLLARYSDDHNPLVVQALGKLASSLPAAMADHIHATIEGLTLKPDNPNFEAVFAAVTRGWGERRKVRIWHRSGTSPNVHEYRFSPYFVEPSAVGYATHAIGHSTWWDDVRTFKLERIQAAELTDEPYEIPEDFDPVRLLDSAWGIMFGETVEEVRLRFDKEVTRRVKESRWHRHEQVEDLPDGGCEYRVPVAHPLEMVWWIRSWGPAVEVLAPASLRALLAEDVRRLGEIYATR